MERFTNFLRNDGVTDGQHRQKLFNDGRSRVVALYVLVEKSIFQLLVGPGGVVNYLRYKKNFVRTHAPFFVVLIYSSLIQI